MLKCSPMIFFGAENREVKSINNKKRTRRKKYSSGFQLVHQIGCYELLRGPDPFWLGIYRVFEFL